LNRLLACAQPTKPAFANCRARLQQQCADPLIACIERGFGTQSWLIFRQPLKAGDHVRKGEKRMTVVYANRFFPYRERMRATR